MDRAGVARRMRATSGWTVVSIALINACGAGRPQALGVSGTLGEGGAYRARADRRPRETSESKMGATKRWLGRSSLQTV
jgi:hypothetical protein